MPEDLGTMSIRLEVKGSRRAARRLRRLDRQITGRRRLYELRIWWRIKKAQRWADRHEIPGPLSHGVHPEGREYACLCWQCFLARELQR